jgi:3-phenylpropionate/trans-cinnamate dioxygenase ferredoxin component
VSPPPKTNPDSPRDAAGGFQDVGAEAEVGEGGMKGFDVSGERVLVARSGGCLFAVGGLCTHQIAYLEDGALEGRQVSCPRHGACFDLATGEPLSAPADMPLPVYDLRVVGGRMLVSRTPIRRPPCQGS